MTCSVCRKRGHNKRYHSRPNAPDSVKPVVAQCSRIGDDRGKMVPERGQRASSGQDDGNKQTFRFIPTPTLSREPHSSGLKSVAATMVPFNQIRFVFRPTM
ncbi:Hypothetical predicted protein [Olea europaea subsp. europaea]|uniref:Uncharacterized protein n=1 Tax=Olea europaea subsp. europaea TaxID=158383 RepID=A0A8S0S7R8_OLEEU|nr:Hypothetical predicted protein [Olea europaea subsp. europaea]